jgi:hypothetical protein
VPVVSRPFLAIVVTGRNDDHGGDLTRRFLQVLRLNEGRLRTAGVDFEIVLVEWRPWSDRPWLSMLLADAFPDLVRHARIGSYVVDERYHAAFGLNGQEAVSDFLALNIGIRRARAPFILTTRRDIGFSSQLIGRMRPGMLRPHALYRAVRIGVSATALEQAAGSGDDELEHPRHLAGIDASPVTPGFGHFLLMEAEAFVRIRGFNEIQRRALIQPDQNFCLKVRSMGVPIIDLDEPVYDFGSQTPADHSDVGANHSGATMPDRSLTERIVYQNHEDWGLGRAPEQRIAAHTTFLEFDWHAVPPLIDLNRLSVRAYHLTDSAVPETPTRDEMELR